MYNMFVFVVDLSRVMNAVRYFFCKYSAENGNSQTLIWINLFSNFLFVLFFYKLKNNSFKGKENTHHHIINIREFGQSAFTLISIIYFIPPSTGSCLFFFLFSFLKSKYHLLNFFVCFAAIIFASTRVTVIFFLSARVTVTVILSSSSYTAVTNLQLAESDSAWYSVRLNFKVIGWLLKRKLKFTIQDYGTNKINDSMHHFSFKQFSHSFLCYSLSKPRFTELC